MKIILFEIRYYLAFLVATSLLLLGVVFNPIENNASEINTSLGDEIIRSKIDFEKLSIIKSADNESSNRTQLIFIEKNNTLIKLLR